MKIAGLPYVSLAMLFGALIGDFLAEKDYSISEQIAVFGFVIFCVGLSVI
jgi:hypothetical protein